MCASLVTGQLLATFRSPASVRIHTPLILLAGLKWDVRIALGSITLCLEPFCTPSSYTETHGHCTDTDTVAFQILTELFLGNRMPVTFSFIFIKWE